MRGAPLIAVIAVPLAAVALVAFLSFRTSPKEPMAKTTMTLTSYVFKEGGTIPSKYTCDGQRGLSPQLQINGVPEGARSLALIMDDPDVPKQLRPDGVFDHWVVFNIAPHTREIREGETPKEAMVGSNSAGQATYTGPCPPPEYEPSEHRYIFALYALDAMLGISEGATKAEVLAAMNGRVLAEAKLVGLYSRK